MICCLIMVTTEQKVYRVIVSLFNIGFQVFFGIVLEVVISFFCLTSSLLPSYGELFTPLYRIAEGSHSRIRFTRFGAQSILRLFFHYCRIFFYSHVLIFVVHSRFMALLRYTSIKLCSLSDQPSFIHCHLYR
jgi:hypothetical protein